MQHVLLIPMDGNLCASCTMYGPWMGTTPLPQLWEHCQNHSASPPCTSRDHKARNLLAGRELRVPRLQAVPPYGQKTRNFLAGARTPSAPTPRLFPPYGHKTGNLLAGRALCAPRPQTVPPFQDPQPPRRASTPSASTPFQESFQ